MLAAKNPSAVVLRLDHEDPMGSHYQMVNFRHPFTGEAGDEHVLEHLVPGFVES